MGYYINPRDMSKEQWLELHGTPLGNIMISGLPDPIAGEHLVCLIDNGWMTAAGIAFSRREAEEFYRPDPRPRKWYFVSDKKLLEVCPDVPLE